MTRILCSQLGCWESAQLTHDDKPWCVAHYRIETAHLRAPA